MPLPGGDSDKLGNRYEQWWTVYQLVRILFKEAQSIRIEDPSTDKAEFLLATADGDELHQAKRNASSGSWTLSLLGNKQNLIIQNIYKQLVGNNKKFVFVSGSDAPELRELSDRSRDAVDFTEFENTFLASEAAKGNFDKMVRMLESPSPASVYDVLQRISIKPIGEESVIDLVKVSIQLLFLSRHEAIISLLRTLVLDSVHQPLTRDNILSSLDKKGHQLRKLSHSSDTLALINETTNQHIAQLQRKLINKKIISRALSQDCLDTIQNSAESVNLIITGKAGGGKTACILECMELLKNENPESRILSFRVDRLPTVSNTQALGQSLGLEESPALVLGAALEQTEQSGVLIIDQLDAISMTSGRNTELFDVVEDLIHEIQGLRTRSRVHLILVCREFDWENDYRFRKLFPKNETKVKIGNFSVEEVKLELSKSSFKVENFSQKQIELLQTPQNLSVFFDAMDSSDDTLEFISSKDLFDLYWQTKQRDIEKRSNSSEKLWIKVLQQIVADITQSQKLSVKKERLDSFSSQYVQRMVSEGVLVFDGKRYGLGHESFFDYCFARFFVNRDKGIVEYLLESEQHLFRRAQVRQVLEYLRDSDPERYLKELSELLQNEKIRYHIKDLCLSFLFSIPRPNREEWSFIHPWMEAEIRLRQEGKEGNDPFKQMLWNRFFYSSSWFHMVDERGIITDWLQAKNNHLVTLGVNYLGAHRGEEGDRIAELLQPYEKEGGDWPGYFSSIMQWVKLEDSKKLREMFLRLLKDGVLDNVRGPIAVNSTFWSLMYGVSEKHPEWITEVAASWMQRRVKIAQDKAVDSQSIDWFHLFDHDDFGSKHILDAANCAPREYLDNVLPVLLEIAQKAVYTGKQVSPIIDSIWSYPRLSGRDSIEPALLEGITVSMDKMYTLDYDYFRLILEKLQRSNLFVANFIVLKSYTIAAKVLANEATTELCLNPWRFHCGYSDSPYWISIQMIAAIVPFCSSENKEKLEKTITEYVPDYERKAGNEKYRGRAEFALLSGIPQDHRSPAAQKRFLELQRKLKTLEVPPRESRAYTVVSPIKPAAAEKMTDEQWIRAMNVYASSEREHDWEHPEKGGAWELAGALEERVKEEPERFSKLLLSIKDEINSAYTTRWLDGLRQSEVSAEIKYSACRKAYNLSREKSGSAIADLIGSIQEDQLPLDIVEILNWLATEHPDPKEELWSVEATGGKPYYGGKIYDYGINTTRGRSVEAIGRLIFHDEENIEVFKKTLWQIAEDKSFAVRSCLAFTLRAVSNADFTLANQLFIILTRPQDEKTAHFLKRRYSLGVIGNVFDSKLSNRLKKDDLLLATPQIDRFVYNNIREHFEDLYFFLHRMINSSIPDVQDDGSRLVSIAALHNFKKAKRLLRKAMKLSSFHRHGIAQVAAANLKYEEHREWCTKKLITFFEDDDKEVRTTASHCFSKLHSIPLESYEELIKVFCQSKAYAEGAFGFLHLLEESTDKLPGTVIYACEKFLERFADEAKDIQTSFAGDVYSISKLAFRTYQQHPNDKWTSQSLNVIDQLCRQDINAVRSGLNEFDR